MNELVALFGTALAGFFAIMNPVANTPIFLGLTDGLSAKERRAVALQAVVVAFIVVGAFAVLGQVIFDLFGITVAAFRVAGGIVVFGIGYKMLQGQDSAEHHTTKLREAVAVAESGREAQGRSGNVSDVGPDAAVASGRDAQGRSGNAGDVESDVGPETVAASGEGKDGVLSLAVSPLGVPLLAGPGTIATAVGFSAGDWRHTAATVVAFFVLCLVTLLAFFGAERVVKVLGRSFLKVVTRLMGLILAVIGTEMFLRGLHEAGF